MIRQKSMVILDEDPDGIIVRRCGYVASYAHGPWRKVATSFGAWVEERWRLYTGGGIAGNGDKWWFRRLGDGDSPSGPLGPFTSQAALSKALRAWREFEVP